MSVSVKERVELAHNAVGRKVPTMVNGKPQIPFLGAGKYQPRGRKAAARCWFPPIRCMKYACTWLRRACPREAWSGLN